MVFLIVFMPGARRHSYLLAALLVQVILDGLMQGFIAQIPIGRMGAPDDIAKVAVFLASPASDYVTGEVIVVDGGRLLS